GARPGDHGQRAAADPHAADRDDRIVLVELTAGELERLEDGQHLLDAGDGGQRLGLELVLGAGDADDRAQLTLAEWGIEAQLADAVEDVVDLFAGGVGPENDDHGGVRGPWTRNRKRFRSWPATPSGRNRARSAARSVPAGRSRSA